MFMFIVALFTAARTWNQRKCPLIVIHWIKRMWYTDTKKYPAVIKKKVRSRHGGSCL